MGRREAPVDPSAGPVERFAYELRKLRQEAGGPTYRAMAKQVPYSVTTLSRAAGGEQFPSLAVVLAYVRACGGDEERCEEWEGRWREISGEVAARSAEEDDGADSPYQGLARFEPADHERFFGRDQLIEAARELVLTRRFAAVFGPSGSGKSSLLRAGLVPALRSRSGELAAIRVLTPGPHPLRTHAAALTPRPSGGDTLVVVDQFEEVFTLCTDPAERAEFIERLLAARAPDSRLRVVIAVRADFYARCAGHRSLADALADSSLLVGPMTQAELRETVVGPAHAAGLIVERELTARLIADVDGEPGGLPLLSHALRETWRRRKGRTLTMAAYEATGGAHGAIAHTAEEAYEALSTQQRELARLVLLRLITPGDGTPDTRRPVPVAELSFGDPTETAHIVDRLARARLLTLRDDSADLAHEALITAWPRLHTWIDEDRERLRAHRRLTEAAQLWHDLGRDPSALYRGTRLATAEQHFSHPGQSATLTPLERIFLTTARTAAATEHRRRRTLLTTLTLVLVLALVAGVVAWQENTTADRRHTEAEARRIASVAEALRFTDPKRAMRLSVAAWRLADTTETRSALVGAVSQREADTFTTRDLGAVGEESVRLTADGRTLVVAGQDRVRSWDLRDPRRTRTYPGPAGHWGLGAEVAPDGRSLALLSESGGVAIWDVRTARVTRRFPGGDVAQLAFGRDGGLLTVETLNGSVTVWDVRDGRRLLEVEGPKRESALSELALSGDGRLLALCGDGHPLEIWDIAASERLAAPWAKRPGGERSCLWGDFALAPDGRSAAVATDEGVRRWDLASGRELPGLPGKRPRTMRFSEDGAFLVTSGPGELLLWRLSSHEAPVLRHSLVNVETVEEFSLDPGAGVLRYMDENEVRSLDLGRAVTDGWTRGSHVRKQLSADGRTLALVANTTGRKGFRLVDVDSGRTVGEPPGQPCVPQETVEDERVAAHCDLTSVLSADGRYYAYWDYATDRLIVWDVANRREHATVRSAPDREGRPGAGPFALSADGRWLYTAGVRGDKDIVEIWDIRRAGQGRKSGTLSGIGGSPLAVRRDASVLVGTGGAVADLGTGRVSPQILREENAQTFLFSPDGSRLAVGDAQGRVTVWDGLLRKRLARLPGIDGGADSDSEMSYTAEDLVRQHQYGVTALAFSPDGKTLAVGEGEGGVQLWDIESSRRLGSPLPTPGDPVLSLAFTPDGRTLRTAGLFTEVQSYDLDPARLATAVCERAGSGLSRAEWQAHLPGLPFREIC
ncbi:hypothetical protein GCM10010232_46810 [Streptomyces amakusaensis]